MEKCAENHTVEELQRQLRERDARIAALEDHLKLVKLQHKKAMEYYEEEIERTSLQLYNAERYLQEQVLRESCFLDNILRSYNGELAQIRRLAAKRMSSTQ